MVFYQNKYLSTFSNGLKGNPSCQNKLINPQLIQIKSIYQYSTEHLTLVRTRTLIK